MLRDLGELHDGCAGEVGHTGETSDLGYAGAAAGINKVAVGREGKFATFGGADDDGFGAGERSLSVNQVEIFGLGDAALVAGAERDHDVAFAFADAFHGNAQVAGLDAVLGTPAGEIGHAAAGDHGLGGRAAFIDAGAADVNFFDERGAQAGVRKRLA